MNIKQIMASIGISLFSLNALGLGQLRLNLGDLNIEAADHKLPRAAILGSGWKQFDSSTNNELCIADSAGDFKFTPQITGKSLGISVNDGSGNYPVFSSGVEGIGYAMGIRQKGTHQWHPLTGNNSEINAVSGSSLLLEARMLYVKTTSGSIDVAENTVTHFDPIKIQCNGNLNWRSAVGEILPASTVVTWAQRTCEVSSVRQTVDLGVHDIAAVRALKVGDTFGHAQQSLTVSCPTRMTVNYTIADNLHPSNINTDIIYLENQGDDPGFAVRVYEAGKASPLRIGGGDRTSLSSNIYSLLDNTSARSAITKTFDFRYVKTSNNVKASDGNAQVTVTLVYK